jgi:hypothetical protein
MPADPLTCVSGGDWDGEAGRDARGPTHLRERGRLGRGGGQGCPRTHSPAGAGAIGTGRRAGMPADPLTCVSGGYWDGG